jgi:type VI secretion system protein VasJ
MAEETTQPAPETASEPKDAATEALLKPISEAEPTGSDPKLSDDFDRVFGEIGKLEAMGGGEPDWAMVHGTSAKILETVGKDLRCVGWWAHARFRQEGVKGLRLGLAAIAAFCATFAANLHPKREKARAAALDWLGTRLEVELPQHLKSAPAADLEAMIKSLDDTQKALEGACASFEGLYRGRAALKAVKAEAPKPPPAAAKPAAARPAAPAARAAPAPLPPPTPSVPSGLEDLVEQLMSRAAELAAGEGESPWSLRMRRQAQWLGTPEALAGGKKYDCESAAPKVRMELEQMFGAKRWPELLERAEALFLEHPFCLDLTFWSAHAAGEVVGPAARDALAGELVALAIRNPKLPRGTDRGGQPLASAATRGFIGQLMAGPRPEGAPPAPTPAGDGAAAAAPAVTVVPVALSLDALPADVEALFTQGKLPEAVRLASAVSAGLSGRAAFCRHLVLAERVQTAGSHALAFSLFRALMSRLRTATLSEWEPALEARCIRGYLQGSRAVKQPVEGERELMDALMLLDPGAGVGLV